MSSIGQIERITQNRVVQFFKNKLDYDYLGDWQDRENKKRPDIVLYVNGIALGVIELKRSSVGISEGIRQNLDNQKKGFIRNFFTTMQMVMAGNDSQGLRYGTIALTL